MDELKKFEIPGIARIESGNGGLTKIVVTTPQAAAEIYLHGAHVTHFQHAGQAPLIWMSKSSMFEPGKPIRGGVPICFPWFGPKKDDPKAPAHGVARLQDWNLESIKQQSDAVYVTLALKPDDKTRVTYIVSVGPALELTLQVQNTSPEPIKFEEALHTYLAVGDIKQVTIEGLNGKKYIDKVDGAKIKDQSDPFVRFTGETDRVYLETPSTCIVNDPAMKRRIEINETGSKATVVWNPWINKAKAMSDFGDDEWTGMVCVETANVAQFAVELAAGATHAMTAKVRGWITQ